MPCRESSKDQFRRSLDRDQGNIPLAEMLCHILPSLYRSQLLTVEDHIALHVTNQSICAQIKQRQIQRWKNVMSISKQAKQLNYWTRLSQAKRLQDLALTTVPDSSTTVTFYHGLLGDFVDPNQYKIICGYSMTGVEGEIHRDVFRTFSSMEYFDVHGIGKTYLFRVLLAIAAYFPDIGYCQGMNYIAATLLLVGPHEEKDIQKCHVDEQAFWIMAAMIRNHNLSELWSPGIPGLRLAIYQFDCLLREHLAPLHSHLQRIGMKSDYFATQWFMTLFARTLPRPTLVLVWNLFFKDGWKAIFRVALVLMSVLQHDILLLTNVESCGAYFRKDPRMGMDAIHSSQLFQDLFQYKITRKKLRFLQDQYHIQMMQSRLDESISLVPLTEGAGEDLNHIRKALHDLDTCVGEDLKVYREKIEKANKEITRAQSTLLLLQHQSMDVTIRLHDVLKMKNQMNAQFHKFMVTVIKPITKTQDFHAIQKYKARIEKLIEQENVTAKEYEETSRKLLFVKMELEEQTLDKERQSQQLLQYIAENERMKITRMKTLFRELDEKCNM